MVSAALVVDLTGEGHALDEVGYLVCLARDGHAIHIELGVCGRDRLYGTVRRGIGKIVQPGRAGILRRGNAWREPRPRVP